ncbi:phage tail assembly chaperone [Proteus terrae]|uniref:phage tail assembly chaperone n=1 Tax=Proteus terrae TaxID=1574161 RepID=UPI00288A831A|nr:phage tail assembly chaperone [Proteus terrae]
MEKPSLKSLALSEKNAFRTKKVNVAEWENAVVMLREPSSPAWMKWREIINHDNAEDEHSLSDIEIAQRNLRADVVMFIDVLRDENGDVVFDESDINDVMAIYGPVHSRLLKQALDLTISVDDAEKK